MGAKISLKVSFRHIIASQIFFGFYKEERMQKAGILVLALVVAVGLVFPGLGVGSSSEEDLCVPMGVLTIGPPEENYEAKRSAVEFPHAVHFDYNCQVCHHTWEKEPEILGCQTSGCHDLTQTPAKDEKRPALAFFKNAYHEMCIGCHKGIKAERKKLIQSGRILKDELPRTGPTGCTECHPKE